LEIFKFQIAKFYKVDCVKSSRKALNSTLAIPTGEKITKGACHFYQFLITISCRLESEKKSDVKITTVVSNLLNNAHGSVPGNWRLFRKLVKNILVLRVIGMKACEMINILTYYIYVPTVQAHFFFYFYPMLKRGHWH
jgi:hypothetical protein